MSNNREEEYEKKRRVLEEKCIECCRKSMPTIERCAYGCTIGRRLRRLETEYSDVTGWSHKKW